MHSQEELNVEKEVEQTEKIEAQQRKKRAAKVKRLKTTAQRGVIATEGAAVYVGPDFDSKPITFLEKGRKVVISRAPQEGQGGIGLFYRIKINGRLGYIADVDVVPQFKVNKNLNVEDNPAFDTPIQEDEDDTKDDDEPIYFRKWVGGGAGVLQFTETFQGKDLSSDVMMISAKLTGPDLLSTLPLDMNFNIALSVPEYYQKELNARSVEGFFFNFDILLPVPLSEMGPVVLYAGLGPYMTFTKFSFKIGQDSFIDSQELRLGASIMAGLAVQFSNNWIVRIEPKYVWEKTKYLGYFATLQYRL